MSLAYGSDLSPAFPEGLDLALQNRTLFNDIHLTTEQDNLLFRKLHPAFSLSLDDISDERKKQLLMDGIGLYEIASGLDNLVGSDTDSPYARLAAAKALTIVKARSTYELLVEGNESLEASVHEVPRPVAFGAEVLDRYSRNQKDVLDYGLVGIALARLYDMSNAAEIARLELETLDS